MLTTLHQAALKPNGLNWTAKMWRFLKPRKKPLKPGVYKTRLLEVKITVDPNLVATYEFLLDTPKKVKNAKV